MKVRLFINFFLLFFFLTILAQGQPKNKSYFQTTNSVFKTSFTSPINNFVFLEEKLCKYWQKTDDSTTNVLELIATDKIMSKACDKYTEPAMDCRLPNSMPNLLRKSKNALINGEISYLTYPIISLNVGSLFTNKEKNSFVVINSFTTITYSALITQLALKTIFRRIQSNRNLTSKLASASLTANNQNFSYRSNRYISKDVAEIRLLSIHETECFS